MFMATFLKLLLSIISGHGDYTAGGGKTVVAVRKKTNSSCRSALGYKLCSPALQSDVLPINQPLHAVIFPSCCRKGTVLPALLTLWKPFISFNMNVISRIMAALRGPWAKSGETAVQYKQFTPLHYLNFYLYAA